MNHTYYLATTGLTKFWDTNVSVHTLGDWCMENEMPNNLKIINQPSLWSTSKEYSEAIETVKTYYEKILISLSEFLNQYHDEHHNVEYWRILIGSWLYRFVCSAYDRYFHIHYLSSKGLDIYTHILNHSDYRIPFDTTVFRILIQSHMYNLQLISDILMHFDNIEKIVLPLQGRAIDKLYSAIINSVRLNSKTDMSPEISSELGDVDILIGTFDIFNIEKINIKNIKLRTYTTKPCLFDHNKIEKIERKNIKVNINESDKFLNIIFNIIPNYIPSIYIENYETLNDSVSKNDIPAILINDNWHQDEVLKMIAAKVKDKRDVTVSYNPGGMTGIVLNEFVENHEIATSDFILNRVPLGRIAAKKCFLLPDKKDEIKKMDSAYILYLSGGFHKPFISDFSSIPCGNTRIKNYFDDQFAFFESIKNDAKESITYKPHPYRENKEATLKIQKQNIKICEYENLSLALCHASFVILDHVSTAIYDILKSEIPFILFWNSDLWQLTDEAKKIFIDANEYGIFHTEPEKAACYINEITKDVFTWWNDPDRKKAVALMKERLYTEDQNPEKYIERCIIKIVSNKGKMNNEI